MGENEQQNIVDTNADLQVINEHDVDMELEEEQASSKQARTALKWRTPLWTANSHFLFEVKPSQPISKLNCIMCIILLSLKCVIRSHSSSRMH